MKKDSLRLDLLLTAILILFAACSCALPLPQPTPFYQTLVPLATVFAYRPTYPIDETQFAVMVARQVLSSPPHFKPVGDQVVVFVERLKLAEAKK